jgi:protein-L-isoaspartate(D-aspartate) O-methyltransferase
MTTDAGRIRLLLELRRAGVSDSRVLSAIERTRRELFVPSFFQDRAYENVALPIGQGQTLSAPDIVARMTAALEVGARMTVLEIGTGTGYQTAILARLARRIYTIERHRELLSQAEARFRALKFSNITTRSGDGWRGWPEIAKFDRILVTAAADEVPEKLLEQLAPDGRMVIPIGAQSREQRLLRLRRIGSEIESQDMGAVRFVPLVAEPLWEESLGRIR